MIIIILTYNNHMFVCSICRALSCLFLCCCCLKKLHAQKIVDKNFNQQFLMKKFKNTK